MHRHDLIGQNAVLADDDATRQLRHRDHPVGSLHTRLFDGIDPTVDILAAAVELRGVHVHHQRLARNPLGRDSGEISQPVVGMDHVELPFEVFGHLRRHHRIPGDLLHQVGAVFSGEGVALFPYIGPLVCPAAANELIVVGGILLRRDVGQHVRINVDERNLLEQLFGKLMIARTDRFHVARIHHADEALVLVAIGTRHDENDLHAVACKTARHTVAGRTQPAGDMGRKLPAEHQHSHLYSIFLF